MRKRLLISFGLAAALVLVVAGSALALGVSGTVSGTAGVGLVLPTAPTFAATLSGADQTVTYAPVLDVTDARGTGIGWHLSVSATTLTSSGHTLAQQVTAVTQGCDTGSTCTVPTSSLTLPVTVGTTAANFYSAAVGTGMGELNVTPTVSIPVPGNAYAGSYTSTITFAATTGP